MKRRTIAMMIIPLMGALSAGCTSFTGGGKGPAGPAGPAGFKGSQGAPGMGAYERYTSEHSDYSGDYEEWIDDLVNGRLAKETPAGTKGLQYVVTSYSIGTEEESGSASISAYVGEESEIVIPDEYGGYPVVSIEESAFRSCSYITKVIIGKNVVTVKANAFSGCSAIEAIYIPASVASIEASAFATKGSPTIYCEALSKPSGWASNWTDAGSNIIWGAEMAK